MTRSVSSRSLVDVVEAAYSLVGDDAQWLARLAKAAHPVLDRGLGVLACVNQVNTLGVVAFATEQAPAAIEQLVHAAMEQPGSGVDDSFLGQPLRFVAVSEAFLGDAVLRGHWEAASRAAGFADGVGVYAHSVEGQSVHLFAASPVLEQPSPRERHVWMRVAVHVAAGHRLRSQLAAPDAILDAQGRMHHVEPAADSGDARGMLRAAVRAMETARGPLRREDASRALALWRGLVGGRWSLVDRWDTDGKRFIAAIENRPTNLDPRALRPREGAAAQLAAAGASPKDIAYALGVTHGNARALLASALGKLGLRSRAELYRWDPARATVHVVATQPAVHAIAIPEHVPAHAALTEAERAVARLAAAGRSNEEIARERNTAVRTVANQMAAILKKLGVSSRADLLRAL